MTDDNHLRRIAQLDQAIAGLETVANVLGTYFTYLQNCGFQRKEAMLLIKDYQKKLLSFCFDDDKFEGNNGLKEEDKNGDS